MAFEDLSQYVIVADPMECVRLAHEAAEAESRGMTCDRDGQASRAIGEYRRAAWSLREAARLCPEGHPDSQVLEQHAEEVLARASYLERLDGNFQAVPLEEHIHSVQLTLGAPDLLSGLTLQDEEELRQAKRSTKVMGVAAAIGGATGLVLLGPLSAAALGLATAVATTREDHAGAAARKVGDAGLVVLTEANRLNKEHEISRRVASVGRCAMEHTRGHALHILGSWSKKNNSFGKLGKQFVFARSTLAHAASKVMA